MTTNHIDQLAQWWEHADEGIGKAGDVVIERDDSPNFETASYVVFTLGRDEHENLTYRRILSRAPKPKPAWHDAVAVTATATDEYGDEITAVWVREGDELWRSDEGGMVLRDDLRDVTPLIEAKVTDGMVDAAYAYAPSLFPVRATARRVLAAALGIETE